MERSELDTKDKIVNSFKDLTQTYSFEKITIKMITKHAGLARPTFYTHFTDKHAIIEWIVEKELMDTLFSLIKMDLESEMLKMIFSYFSKNRSFYIEIFKIEGQNSFDQVLKSQFFHLFQQVIQKSKQLNDVPVSLELLAHHYSAVLVNTVYFLITREDLKTVTDEDIYETALYISSHSIKDILNPSNQS